MGGGIPFSLDRHAVGSQSRPKKFYPDRPKMVPTKARFLYRVTKELLLSLFILDVIGFLGRDVSMHSVYFASSRIPFFTRLEDVTMEEPVARLTTSLLH